jgi:hypothetical protein
LCGVVALSIPIPKARLSWDYIWRTFLRLHSICSPSCSVYWFRFACLVSRSTLVLLVETDFMHVLPMRYHHLSSKSNQKPSQCRKNSFCDHSFLSRSIRISYFTDSKHRNQRGEVITAEHAWREEPFCKYPDVHETMIAYAPVKKGDRRLLCL